MSLILQNVSRKYENSGAEVLQNISLQITDGEFVSIVGPSGCGKSTLINIITGLDKASSGSVTLDGREITSPGAERTLVFQENALFPWLTVLENIEFGLKIKKLSKKEREEKALHYLNMVNLGAYRDYPIHQLSGGMKQRVSIARALALESEILLMDEPFGAVDSQTRSVLHDELIRLWQENRKTILFITHDIEEAVKLSDRVIVLGYTPDNVKEIIPISLPRPRAVDKHFLQYSNEIKAQIQRCVKYAG